MRPLISVPCGQQTYRSDRLREQIGHYVTVNKDDCVLLFDADRRKTGTV